MATKQTIDQAQKEVSELTRKIDELFDEYLATSKMPANQKVVNVGRALGAYHVGWIAGLKGQCDQANNRILFVDITGAAKDKDEPFRKASARKNK